MKIFGKNKKAMKTNDQNENKTNANQDSLQSESKNNENENKDATQEEKQDKSASKTQIYNLIILDESGSMSCVRNATIQGCNKVLETIMEAQRTYQNEQEHFVSIYNFDTTNSRYILQNKPISELNGYQIGTSDYSPNGCTPLYDAIGTTVSALQEHFSALKEDCCAQVTIITDGMENASRQYNHAQISRMISDLKEQGWIFTFIGANIDAAATAQHLKIDSSLQFTQDEEGMNEMWCTEMAAKRRWYDAEARMKNATEEDRLLSRKKISKGYFDEDSDTFTNPDK